MATDLANAGWQTIAGPLNGTNLLLEPTNPAAFYRIESQ
jgi:hypothetical protein